MCGAVRRQGVKGDLKEAAFYEWLFYWKSRAER